MLETRYWFEIVLNSAKFIMFHAVMIVQYIENRKLHEALSVLGIQSE